MMCCNNLLIIERPKLGMVLPCFNEAEGLVASLETLLNLLDELQRKKKLAADSFILCVDDGSRDATWEIIERFSETSRQVYGIKLSRNQGHQNALLAGMEYVQNKCDCLISIDADLQQDENSIESFVDKFAEGSDIVLGIRNDRKTDGFFKKLTALAFYRLVSLLGVEITKNHADFRLLSNRANLALLQFKEANLFLRGLVPLIGFKTDYIYFDVKERFAGKSKYTIKKMMSFALDGITSFSVVPLRIIAFSGFFVFFLSFIMGLYVLWIYLISGGTVPGWASTVLPIYCLGGLQILSLGVVGEYIGRIYMETKQRPRYFIEKTTQNALHSS